MIAQQHWLSCYQCMVLQNVEDREHCNTNAEAMDSNPIEARGAGTPIHYLYGYVPSDRSWFWSSWFRTGYRLKRRFLERSIIFRMHKSSSFVSSHLLFKDRLLLKIQFNGFTSKLLCSCCTLCFSMQGGRILALAASADSAILDK